MASQELVQSFCTPLENDKGEEFKGSYVSYAIFSSQEDADRYEDVVDYGLDNFAYELTASRLLPPGYYVSDIMEKMETVKEVPVGGVVTDLRGDRFKETPVFFKQLQK